MILIIIMIQSLKKLSSNLNIVCLSRIFKLGLLTILVNVCSNVKILSCFLVHVQRLWKCKNFPKILPDYLKKIKGDSATFFILYFSFHL